MSDPKLARSLSKYQPLSLCDYQEQGKACTQELLGTRGSCAASAVSADRSGPGRAAAASSALSPR